MFEPIGTIRTPFKEKVSAPRQPRAALGVRGTVELLPQYEHALSDLDRWEYVWLLFLFDRNEGWRPKVLPPRSDGKRRGVFATRSPHRPNPIGMSVVKLESVEGLTLHVANVDILDGTPLLDIKPYVAYADAYPDAGGGWLPPDDPAPAYDVVWSPRAEAADRYLRDTHGIELRATVTSILALGPQPHPYRRIRKDGDALKLAYKDWRVRFQVEGRAVTVLSVHTGYRAKELALSDDPGLLPHRAIAERF
jgi:tRNA-Thr(GGU) m(6)t(6)A37 methyltransferase TsaA